MKWALAATVLTMIFVCAACHRGVASTHSSQSSQQPRIIRPFEGVTVILDETQGSQVELQSWVCLDGGWLEQIACGPNSREHESLVVMKAKPSQIHAALLMAGFEAGAPGRWTYENEQLGTIPPSGEKLAVLVRYTNSQGKLVEMPVQNWIRDLPRENAKPQEFPNAPWIFGGSRFARNPPGMEPAGGEHYVADMTGSIIGLVTFGDEVVGFSSVLSDQADIQPPEWELNPDTVPPIGTEVTVILRRWTIGVHVILDANRTPGIRAAAD